MIQYENEDIWALEHCVINCLYSFISFQKYQEQVLETFKTDGVPLPGEMSGEVLRCNFYIETFHNYLSEMYSFFERKGDDEILCQLKLDETQRETHRKIRHGLIHFGKKGSPNHYDALKMKMELTKNAGLDIEVDDFLTMVRYSKKMLNEPGSYELVKDGINKRLNSLLGLFNMKVDKKFIDELMG